MEKSGSTACPCQSGRDYSACCAPYHSGLAATDAEKLMRSRYSAYVLKLKPYLQDTWHPTTRPQDLSLDSIPATKWLGLTVKRFEQIDDVHAIVEFVAKYRIGGNSAQRLHEISRFIRQDDRWYYTDGAPN